MNLEYDLKKNTINESLLFFFIEKKKLTIIDFICYMQFEYFCSFFVSVLTDIMNDNYHHLEFPLFSVQSFQDFFELKINYSENIPNIELNTDMKVYERLKYVNIIKNENDLIFIPNRKKTIESFKEMFKRENKIIFQKILKTIFDKIFLILHNDGSKKCHLSYKNNFLIFILKEN